MLFSSSSLSTFLSLATIAQIQLINLPAKALARPHAHACDDHLPLTTDDNNGQSTLELPLIELPSGSSRDGLSLPDISPLITGSVSNPEIPGHTKPSGGHDHEPSKPKKPIKPLDSHDDHDHENLENHGSSSLPVTKPAKPPKDDGTTKNKPVRPPKDDGTTKKKPVKSPKGGNSFPKQKPEKPPKGTETPPSESEEDGKQKPPSGATQRSGGDTTVTATGSSTGKGKGNGRGRGRGSAGAGAGAGGSTRTSTDTGLQLTSDRNGLNPTMDIFIFDPKTPLPPAKIYVPLPTSTEPKCEVNSYEELAGCLSSKNIVIGDMTVPAGVTLDFTKLAPKTIVTINGRVTFTAKKGWEGPLIHIAGNELSFVGQGILDGQGMEHWDGKGKGGTSKPQFITAWPVNRFKIIGLTLVDMPQFGMYFQGNDILIASITIDNRAAGLDMKLAKNTDAIKLSHCNRVIIRDCVIWNQDDCVAALSGGDFDIFNMACANSHGLTIGSLGNSASLNDVIGVTFSNSILTLGTHGCRTKSVPGKEGLARNILYQDITLVQVEIGVALYQNYDGKDGKGAVGTGVLFEGYKFINVQGTVTRQAQNIACGNCLNIDLSGVSLTAYEGASLTGNYIEGI